MTQLLSTHAAFSDAIVKIGGRFKSTVVCAMRDAGLKLQRFDQQFGDRFYDFGFSAGACVVGGVGMTVRGKVPFVCGRAMTLVGRCYEFIRNSACYPNVNVKFIGSHAGFSLAQDGGCAQTFDDLALMRVLPNMKVFSPADYVEACRLFEWLAQDYGPAYVRLSSVPVPAVHPQSFVFYPEKGTVLRRGSTVSIFTTGTMVSASLAAADLLQQKGIAATVVDMAVLKPLDGAFVREIAASVKMCVTVEEHSVIGGLGAAVRDVLYGAANFPLHVIGLQDCFGVSAPMQDLYRAACLTPEGIAAQIEKLI